MGTRRGQLLRPSEVKRAVVEPVEGRRAGRGGKRTLCKAGPSSAWRQKHRAGCEAGLSSAWRRKHRAGCGRKEARGSRGGQGLAPEPPSLVSERCSTHGGLASKGWIVVCPDGGSTKSGVENLDGVRGLWPQHSLLGGTGSLIFPRDAGSGIIMPI